MTDQDLYKSLERRGYKVRKDQHFTDTDRNGNKRTYITLERNGFTPHYYCLENGRIYVNI
ncbi:MAG: hypothetical protein EAZ08_09060 [Cytophagales bacterium]|nr:MAG: hypothetical protein EAZ08_09060 [Cytophagales bacterium]